MIRIFTCNSCSRIHLVIGNTQIHFNSLQYLKKYLENLDSIDTAYYAAINRKKGLAKVIIIPLTDNGMAHLGFTEQEFETLKETVRNYINKDRKWKCPKLNMKLDEFPSLMLN